jgi:hypothetical protein
MTVLLGVDWRRVKLYCMRMTTVEQLVVWGLAWSVVQMWRYQAGRIPRAPKERT